MGNDTLEVTSHLFFCQFFIGKPAKKMIDRYQRNQVALPEGIPIRTLFRDVQGHRRLMPSDLLQNHSAKIHSSLSQLQWLWDGDHQLSSGKSVNHNLPTWGVSPVLSLRRLSYQNSPLPSMKIQTPGTGIARGSPPSWSTKKSGHLQPRSLNHQAATI